MSDSEPKYFKPVDRTDLPKGMVAYKMKDWTNQSGQVLSHVIKIDGDERNKNGIIHQIGEDISKIIYDARVAKGEATYVSGNINKLVVDMSAVDFISN